MPKMTDNYAPPGQNILYLAAARVGVRLNWDEAGRLAEEIDRVGWRQNVHVSRYERERDRWKTIYGNPEATGC